MLGSGRSCPPTARCTSPGPSTHGTVPSAAGRLSVLALLASAADDEAPRAVEFHRKHLIETVLHTGAQQPRQRGPQPRLRNPDPVRPGRVPLQTASQVRGNQYATTLAP